MTEAQLYKRCDEVLGHYLEALGFCWWQPGRYLRQVEGGEDRISVSRGPPSNATTHFSVWIGYHPEYMRPVDELHDVPKEQRGVLTPPYLTPVGANRKPKYWSYKNSEVLEKSLQHVIFCLERAGFAWMESLRNPRVFAANADPVAALPYGLANEVAGNLDAAMAGYREALRRELAIIERIQGKRSEEAFLRDGAKVFIFVAAKLGVERERVEHFRKKLNWFADIKPLPASPQDGRA
jgi:hypothetical protein